MQETIHKHTSFTLEIIYHLGTYENSIHFIFDHASKKCSIVDPAWEADLFIDRVKERGYELTDIWLTHWHPDHTNAVDELAHKTGATITAGINEVPYLRLEHPIKTVEDNDIVSIGNTDARIINTPGHTAGGICYALDGHLIAGDTLFVYGAGHCVMPGGSANIFFNSLQKLKQLPDDMMLHCGHDYGSTISSTMGEQKKGNPFLLIDDEDDFVRYRNNIHDGSRTYPMSAMTKDEVYALL
ncbi:MAG TPA: MBL fold metallo-hydrolase [Candidatus Thioglobus sp.]|jgi:glyoxylase-like metal-dependent hydrolase (beta-lactamase superfamily II)|nr:MBL fold metallo-hydrolase [Candidatus Thioglobus sp.]HIL42071.1 MBL fold metallo-hydrolase [Gammaproteobacteria bacterium]